MFLPDENTFLTFDGAKLGLTVWPAQEGDAEHVVVGVHGMNDYAAAFEYAAPYWAARGVTTYAYDQRGFGRSVGRGRWPQEDLMREDLRTAIKLARERHPDAVLTIVGISMGGAVAMTAFGSEAPPEGVDRLILSGPGLRGWGALPALHRASLWASTKVRPGWVVTPPKFAADRIVPSDNIEMLKARGRDPLNTFENRIDQVYGVVTVMENAHLAAPSLPENTLLLYGARDDIIPKAFMRRTAPHLPGHVKTAYYEAGYHMLMRDLQAETVWADQLAFMRDPSGRLPSNAPPLPWLEPVSSEGSRQAAP
ncbi:MAG: alpha/beta fold hydrolase [Pseudomonadota bacterium]